jgi:hypothetical protein
VVRVVVLVAVVTADDADSKRVYNKPRREIKNEELEIPLEMCLILFLFKRDKMWQIFTLAKNYLNNCGINNNIIKQQH